MPRRRKRFKNSKRAIWQELSKQLGADYFQGKWTKPDRVEAYVGEWVVTMDTYTVDKVVFTRLRAPYVNWDDFRFKIFRSQFYHRIGKKFGMQDVIVGYPEFDDAFIIQGNDERKLKAFFSHPEIREIISYQPSINLEIRPDAPLFHKKFPEDVNELVFYVPGIIKNLNRLYDLFELFAIVLEHLCEIGTAYEDDPQFGYYDKR
ncbi:MAG: DUF3137 domain-containing protein [Bacteroidota bacterium]